MPYQAKNSKEVASRLTPYGFEFGAAKVERFASHKGYVVIGVTTKKKRLEITVTPTGLMRVNAQNVTT